MAWRSAANGDATAAVVSMRAAADKEEALGKAEGYAGPIVPARDELGELLLSLDRPIEALQAFKASLVSAPGRRAALHGARRAEERQKAGG